MAAVKLQTIIAERALATTTLHSPRAPGKQLEETVARRGAGAALGDERSNEVGGGHIEGVVGGGAVLGCQAHRDAPALLGPAFDVGYLARVAALDRDRRPLFDLPIDRRRGQCDVERHVVVAGRQRLQVSADLVRDIAACGGAVAADDAQIDKALAHQVAAGIVDNDGVRHALLAELPGGEAGALVAWPRLVDPDMDRDAVMVGAVDRGERRVGKECRSRWSP